LGILYIKSLGGTLWKLQEVRSGSYRTSRIATRIPESNSIIGSRSEFEIAIVLAAMTAVWLDEAIDVT
jgi:hypothetical protein